MTRDDIKAINAVLDAVDSKDGMPEWEDGIDLAHDRWESAGSPRVTVPDREALLWASAALMKVAVAQLLYDEKGEDHESIKAVAAFLRALGGE